MILKLDPRWPLVWRSPSSVQLGIDPPLIILDEVTETQERVLSALAVGVSDAGLGIVSRSRLEEAHELLHLISAALLSPGAEREPVLVAISGVGALVTELARALGGSGVHTVIADRAEDLLDQGADFAVAVGHYVLPPALHSLWLRRDVPHLPVVFSDTGVHVGPIVEPGASPCLRCLELHRRDTDSTWPAVAAQVLGRGGSAESALLAIEGAAAAARLVLGRFEGGGGSRDARAGASVSVRIDAETGARTTREWTAHPECGCLGIAALIETGASATRVPRATAGQRGSDWAAVARRVRTPGPTTSSD